jgi:transcriptional regulator with XRE-family HTH domain
MDLAERLRQEACKRRLGCTALARLVEIDKSAMSRFLNGRRGLSMAALNRMADALGLELVPRRGRKKGGGL